MRDFYDRQDHAQEETVYLVGLLIVGSIAVVAVTAFVMAAAVTGFCYANVVRVTNGEVPPDWLQENFLKFLIPSLFISISLVVGSMVRRMMQVSETGGHGIAKGLGGKRVLDLDATGDQRTLLNVIDELAIAAGIKRPGIYVLDDMAINGFAAGWDQKDAVVAVTRGAMDRLNREQLQGVIAHEFSHIIKKDIALNTQLIGALAGLRALGDTADWCLDKKGVRSQGLGANPMGSVLLAVIGAAIYPIGKLGQFFAALIVCEVNRQREFLADAHAVELTRNPLGLREALEMIAANGDVASSKVGGVETSHLFFANSQESRSRMFATHPPLEERISRLNNGSPPTIRDEETVITDVCVGAQVASSVF